MKKVLYENLITLTKEMSKTNFEIYIDVDSDYNKLIFECEYSPKAVDDLSLCEKLIKQAYAKYYSKEDATKMDWKNSSPINNLITISIDDENQKYLGCAHKQSPKQIHTISESVSSKGFEPNKIKKGVYRVVLNIHLVTDKDVKYSLKVLGED